MFAKVAARVAKVLWGAFKARKTEIRVSEARTVDRLQMSCEHVGLELTPKTKLSETVSSAYK